MRVVHVVKVKGVAGAENHLLLLLAGLRERGIDAEFLLLVEPSLPVDEMVQAAEARGIPTERVLINGNLDLGLYRRLWRELRARKPDIVHTHLLHADLFAVPTAWLMRFRTSRTQRTIIISSRHNDDAFRLQPYQRILNNLLWHMTDAGIAISEAVRRFSIDREGVRPDRIHTIYYGSHSERDDPELRRAVRDELDIPPEATVIGLVCRLIEQKGIAYGIRAFGQIADQFPQARLLIVGEGKLRNSLEAEVRALKLGDRVQFLGWRVDGARMMAAFDIFLMPSLWEGFGLVMLEAMAHSLPIVGSAVSAIPEVVLNGETGLLVPPRDENGLADALALLLRDAPLRKHMGLMGLDRLETQFSVTKMVDETAKLYALLTTR
jgi:glycosyltransferase involved in cell wall biosynthesis